MNQSHMMGILIGGLLPALIFGIGGFFQKASIQAGIGIGPYLLCAGLGAVIAGALFCAFMPNRTISISSGSYAVLIGVCWTVAMGLVAMALFKYGTPLSRLAPLYNMNTMVVVLLSLWLYSEWKNVHVTPLLIGALLIVVGGTLVARS